MHKYFNPYDSPYDSYINFMNVLDNLQSRCAKPANGGELGGLSQNAESAALQMIE